MLANLRSEGPFSVRPIPLNLVIAVVVAMVAAALVFTTASASAMAGAETRVRASGQPTTGLVGPPQWETAGQRLGKDAAGHQIVVATGVAAKTDIGLSGRGLVPAAGTRIRPAGIPEGWRITGTKSSGGVLYRDPTNAGNSVRVMQGSPNSPFPNSHALYVRWQRNGQPLDQYGNLLPSAKVPEAHIPLGDFRFLPEVFGP